MKTLCGLFRVDNIDAVNLKEKTEKYFISIGLTEEQLDILGEKFVKDKSLYKNGVAYMKQYSICALVISIVSVLTFFFSLSPRILISSSSAPIIIILKLVSVV